MTNSIHIIWFKRDLRVSDHAPLTASAQAGRVLPLYIIEPELWKLPDSSRRHWHFIHDSLLDLQRDLAALGAPLVIRIGEATEVLEKLPKLPAPMLSLGKANRNRLENPRRGRD